MELVGIEPVGWLANDFQLVFPQMGEEGLLSINLDVEGKVRTDGLAFVVCGELVYRKIYLHYYSLNAALLLHYLSVLPLFQKIANKCGTT